MHAFLVFLLLGSLLVFLSSCLRLLLLLLLLLPSAVVSRYTPLGIGEKGLQGASPIIYPAISRLHIPGGSV